MQPTGEASPDTIAELRDRAAAALERGDPLAAYDLANRGLTLAPNDRETRQLLARALARSGAASRALDVAAGLYASGLRDEETIGIVARAHKDQWLDNRHATDAEAHLQRALTFYAEGHERHHSSWMGINRATLLLMNGQHDAAAAVARSVERQCQERLATSGGRQEEYWASATIAEASLIRGDIENAIRWYSNTRKLALLGAQRLGDFGSTVRNARLLIEHREVPAALEAALTLPPVIVFAGHMIDRPGRPDPRFRGEQEQRVADAIRDHLARLDPILGYASAACGSDILFFEQMLARGADIHVVLPFDREQFVRSSVDVIPAGDWRRRFDRVLERAQDVTVASEGSAGTSEYAFEYAALVLFGLALSRAQHIGAHVHGLAVWDGSSGDGPGGTEASVRAWRARGVDVDIVAPDGSPLPVAVHAVRTPHTATTSEELGAVLFADAVGYSRLAEEQIPLFVEQFLRPVADLAARSAERPLTANTWGDGLFFVFEGVEPAGELGLALCRLTSETDWQAKGLPAELNVRVGLHVGPIFRYQDPVTGRLNFFGAHVSRGARIEPITPPAHVYASEAFAAISAAAGVTSYTCEYVGRTALAKAYGTYPAYHVRRSHSLST